MSRDYKPRTTRNNRSRQRNKHSESNVTWWRWLLVALLIIGFGYFLTSLQDDSSPKLRSTSEVKSLPLKPKHRKPTKEKPEKQVQKEPEFVEPQFEFYDILENKEVRIPDYEVKTRAREEVVGKAKPAHYILQVGSFREFKEADKLKARLAFMGIESKIEKAKVGNVVWNRLKIGPYAKMSTVERVRSRLKKNGISTIVTELQS